MVSAADGAWAEDPQFPVMDWKSEVSNDDTRLGYFDWVDEQRMHRQ